MDRENAEKETKLESGREEKRRVGEEKESEEIQSKYGIQLSEISFHTSDVAIGKPMMCPLQSAR